MGRLERRRHLGTGTEECRIRRDLRRGAAERPLVLVIDEGQARLVEADALWGKDTYETDDALQTQLGDPGSWTITCIGPAGEQCSLLAGIVNEKGRIAARSGVGAVMGSKKLKAIALRAKKGARIPVADKEGLRVVQKQYGELIKTSGFLKGLTTAGTGGSVSFLVSIGDCPTNNWATTGTEAMPTCGNLDTPAMDVYKLKAYGCNACPVRCGALLHIDEGPYASQDETHRPEYETLAALGTLCHNDSAEAVIRANEICNRYGIDTIGVGGVIAFAIECYENGLVTRDDTGGLELNWGNSTAVVALTEQIARREGFGAVLADGSKRAASRSAAAASSTPCTWAVASCRCTTRARTPAWASSTSPTPLPRSTVDHRGWRYSTRERLWAPIPCSSRALRDRSGTTTRRVSSTLVGPPTGSS